MPRACRPRRPKSPAPWASAASARRKTGIATNGDHRHPTRHPGPDRRADRCRGRAALADRNRPRHGLQQRPRGARPVLLLMEITDTQRAILALIAERIDAEGVPPSQTEIARAMGFSSVRAAQYLS